MKHKMKLNPEPFTKMKQGTKTIEIRLNDEKRRELCIGDEVEFHRSDNEAETLLVRITGLFPFKTFREMFAAFPPAAYGSESQDECPLVYQIYSPEQEATYGVLAIQVAVIE
jgi:ASC-1-like (ASCH) protein